MYRLVKGLGMAAVAAAMLVGCAEPQGSKPMAVPLSVPAVAPAPECSIPSLQPLDLEKTDYRFRMIGGPYRVTSSDSSVEVVVNKHGVDPNQIDLQPARFGPNVGRAAITVTDERTGCGFTFTVLVQK